MKTQMRVDDVDACVASENQDGDYCLMFVDIDGNFFGWGEVAGIHEDYRGPFATAKEANGAMDDFVTETECGYLADETGGETRLRKT